MNFFVNSSRGWILYNLIVTFEWMRVGAVDLDTLFFESTGFVLIEKSVSNSAIRKVNALNYT